MLALVLCAAACSHAPPSADTTDGAAVTEAEARPWGVNDVSILYPFPRAGEGQHLLSMQPSRPDGTTAVLLPESVYSMLGDPQRSPFKFLVEAPGQDELYPALRVVSARVDPCFDATAAAHGPCARQVRLTVQPMTTFGADPATQTYDFTDASLHLFYELDEARFEALVAGLDALRTPETAGAPLGPHPVMKREGLGGPWAQGLREVLLAACDESNLTRMTFMGTGRAGNNWFWGGLERGADGAFAPMTVPGLGRSLDGFTQNGFGEQLSGTPFEGGAFPNELLDTQTARGLSASKFRKAVDRVRRLENPDLVPTGEVNCGSCHVATATLENVFAARGVSALDTPSTFRAPEGFEAQAFEPPAPSRGRNLHAFSYFRGREVVSPRALNESIRVAHVLSTRPAPAAAAAPAGR
jgi:hypothetical protein